MFWFVLFLPRFSLSEMEREKDNSFSKIKEKDTNFIFYW